ncbi:MAG: hypothetical protein FWG99_05820 [Treponema sp.]|nr:hypothetical protein [Treponema sp.]
MANKKMWLGILAILLVFGLTVIGCDTGGGGGSGGGGKIEGTWGDGSSHEQTITFTGSNYVFADEDGAVLSSGTYTLSSNGKDITYNQTFPSTDTYEGYYFPRDNPPQLTADFSGFNVTYYKKDGSTNGGGDITYTVDAKGTPTDYIKFYFQGEVTDLTLSHITVTNVTGAVTVTSLSTVSANLGEWTYELYVTTTQSGTVKIKVTKAGIEAEEKEVTVQAGSGLGETDITYTVEARETPTERIVFLFQGEVTDLAVTDITITDGTGSLIANELSPVFILLNQWRYELFVFAVQSGTVYIKVTKDGIETVEKEVTVIKGLDDNLVLDDGWAWVSSGGSGDGGYIFKSDATYQRIEKIGDSWKVERTGTWKAYGGQLTWDPGSSSGSIGYSVEGNIFTLAGNGFTKTNIGVIN